MAHTYSSCLYHIVFATAGRNPVLVDDIRPSVCEYIGGIVRGLDGVLITSGGIEDHLHLLARLRVRVAVSSAVRDIKAFSSKWINEQQLTRSRFAWQGGFSAFTVSTSQVASVRRYIARQCEHHRSKGYREELLQLLNKHDIAFDERYV